MPHLLKPAPDFDNSLKFQACSLCQTFDTIKEIWNLACQKSYIISDPFYLNIHLKPSSKSNTIMKNLYHFACRYILITRYHLHLYLDLVIMWDK